MGIDLASGPDYTRWIALDQLHVHKSRALFEAMNRAESAVTRLMPAMREQTMARHRAVLEAAITRSQK
jgi:hypothetical protein